MLNLHSNIKFIVDSTDDNEEKNFSDLSLKLIEIHTESNNIRKANHAWTSYKLSAINLIILFDINWQNYTLTLSLIDDFTFDKEIR